MPGVAEERECHEHKQGQTGAEQRQDAGAAERDAEHDQFERPRLRARGKQSDGDDHGKEHQAREPDEPVEQRGRERVRGSVLRRGVGNPHYVTADGRRQQLAEEQGNRKDPGQVEDAEPEPPRAQQHLPAPGRDDDKHDIPESGERQWRGLRGTNQPPRRAQLAPEQPRQQTEQQRRKQHPPKRRKNALQPRAQSPRRVASVPSVLSVRFCARASFSRLSIRSLMPDSDSPRNPAANSTSPATTSSITR
jgi:hypothetical protein